MFRNFRRFRRNDIFTADRRGSVAVVFAVCLPMMLGASAFAIDLGTTYLQRRTLQTAADSAALAAAQWPSQADVVIRKILDDNGQKDATYQILMGTFTDSAAIDADHRFVVSPGGSAVRVVAQKAAPVYFARIFGLDNIPMSVQSDAHVIPVVALSAGSRLAAVDPTLVNAVLTPLTGVNLNLNAMDYQGLAKSQIALGPLLQGLTDNLGLPRATTLAKDVLSRPIKLSTLLQIVATTLDSSGDLVGASVLRKASQQVVSADLTVVPGDIIKLDGGIENLAVGYPAAGLQTSVSVLGMLNAAINRRGIGNTVSTGLTIPGLGKTTVDMMLGEAQQSARSIAVGTNLPAVQTDQLRLRAQVQTTGVLAALNVGVNLPIELVAAGGTAAVTATVCATDPTQRVVTVTARPGVVKLAIGKFVGALKDANTQDRLASTVLASAAIATIEGSSYASIAQTTPVTLTFTGAEIGNGTVKTAKTTTVLQSLMKSLLTETAITINLGPLGLPVPGLTGAVSTLLGGLLQPLDNMLTGVLDVAGISLGELDVRVDSLVCDAPKLVM